MRLDAPELQLIVVKHGLEALSDEVLADGFDDWVPISTVEGLSRVLDPNQTDRMRWSEVLEVIRALVESNLMEAGEISSGTFVVTTETTDEWISRVDRAHETGDHELWGYLIWLRNTAAGMQRGAEVLRKTNRLREDPKAQNRQ